MPDLYRYWIDHSYVLIVCISGISVLLVVLFSFVWSIPAIPPINIGVPLKRALDKCTKLLRSPSVNNPRIIITCLICGTVIIALSIHRFTAPGYEFHGSSAGTVPIMWRYNKRTGQTEISYAGQPWKVVEESTPSWATTK